MDSNWTITRSQPFSPISEIIGVKLERLSHPSRYPESGATPRFDRTDPAGHHFVPAITAIAEIFSGSNLADVGKRTHRGPFDRVTGDIRGLDR
jgi:hypothetical protein